MTEAALPQPDEVIVAGDPGDETARRYRYQWSYAAILCCALLDATSDIIEVFCEHHEDVLAKHGDGKFSGFQIKTREIDQPVWKASDEPVRTACARFAKLEATFPDTFKAFRFLTNHPIYQSESSNCIRYVGDTVKAAERIGDLPSPISRFVGQISKDCGCTVEIVFAALKKTEFSDDLPKLADMEIRLVSTLCMVWNKSAECTMVAVQRAARALVADCCRASSLAHEEILPGYIYALSFPNQDEAALRIAGKKFDCTTVIQILESGLNAAANLESDPSALIEPGTGTDDLLLQKLDAGGFSAVSLNSARDLRDKADYLGLVWTKKLGRERGLQRYGHIRSLVLNDAAHSFEVTQDPSQQFGVRMLSQLRSQFDERRENGSQLFDCTNEHLEGFAYSLTSQCKVQWSLDRPWERR